MLLWFWPPHNCSHWWFQPTTNTVSFSFAGFVYFPIKSRAVKCVLLGVKLRQSRVFPASFSQQPYRRHISGRDVWSGSHSGKTQTWDVICSSESNWIPSLLRVGISVVLKGFCNYTIYTGNTTCAGHVIDLHHGLWNYRTGPVFVLARDENQQKTLWELQEDMDSFQSMMLIVVL